jgi:predicted dienelactone hydrolase
MALFFLLAVVVQLPVGPIHAQDKPWVDDPGKIGRYTVGHTSYLMTDKGNGNRPVYMSVWYPAEAWSVNSSTSPAQYPLDPYSTNLPISTSSDWEPLGYDRAYEGLAPSDHGPFPLVVFSPGWGCDAWMYIYIGTRLASHGYVVAVIEHWADGEWSWSQYDDLLTAMVNRPKDVSFAITTLLGKNTKRGDLLNRTIDPKRIVASGHSLGGYATYALAGGDQLVCDALVAAYFGDDTLPYPADTCVSTLPDRRIRTIVSVDGSSWLLRYRELSNISMPALILGETVEYSENMDPGFRDWIARPHAAINSGDSYRVDISGANHLTFTNLCDGVQVLYNLGVFSAADVTAWETSWPCATTGWNPVTIPYAEMQRVVTMYTIAFLDVYLGDMGGKGIDRSILTPEYALRHLPTVAQFFDSERCYAAIPDHTYFRYRPHQVSNECDTAQKDPTGWFGTPTTSGIATPMLRAPINNVWHRPPIK